jgi:hypothetical protein
LTVDGSTDTAVVPIVCGLHPESDVSEKTVHVGEVGIDLAAPLAALLGPAASAFSAKVGVPINLTKVTARVQSSGLMSHECEWVIADNTLTYTVNPMIVVQTPVIGTLEVTADLRLGVHRTYLSFLHRIYCQSVRSSRYRLNTIDQMLVAVSSEAPRTDLLDSRPLPSIQKLDAEPRSQTAAATTTPDLRQTTAQTHPHDVGAARGARPTRRPAHRVSALSVACTFASEILDADDDDAVLQGKWRPDAIARPESSGQEEPPSSGPCLSFYIPVVAIQADHVLRCGTCESPAHPHPRPLAVRARGAHTRWVMTRAATMHTMIWSL